MLGTRSLPDINMSFKILVLLALVAVAAAGRPSYSYGAPQEESSEEDFGPARYDFNYAVKDEDSGNDFGHQETRDGDRTDGSYYVQLPDGRLQKVTYYVDGDSGFIVNVEYEGEARHPDPESSEEDRYSYTPPQPSSLYRRPN